MGLLSGGWMRCPPLAATPSHVSYGRNVAEADSVEKKLAARLKVI